jgi:hypothetical protein
VNFKQPTLTVSSIASGTFGRITSAEDGRIGQVVVKVLW